MADECLSKRDYFAAAIYQGLLFRGEDYYTSMLRAYKLADEFIKVSKMPPQEVAGVKGEKNE